MRHAPPPCVLTSALRHVASASRTGLASFHAPRPSSCHNFTGRGEGHPGYRPRGEPLKLILEWTNGLVDSGHFLPPCFSWD
ncbi:hypothetical protein OYC64_002188 [Pagothenia borchgrevinki]|uniref:Uncharacterized protein n=1 Tax=Pagothenia borchgrevinki TaxID=8213 RepID=A0ABD2H7L4_PAGBO